VKRRRPASTGKKAAAKKSVVRKKTPNRPAVSAKKSGAAAKKRTKSSVRPSRVRAEDRETRTADYTVRTLDSTRGLGLESGGQSGDTEGLSRSETADSESVEELLEEGQAFEAGIVSGVENAPDADAGEVTTREVPEDDVPQEYLDED